MSVHCKNMYLEGEKYLEILSLLLYGLSHFGAFQQLPWIFSKMHQNSLSWKAEQVDPKAETEGRAAENGFYRRIEQKTKT